jgi:hypothetical protein
MSDEDNDYVFPGTMTKGLHLRDYFAAAALPTVLQKMDPFWNRMPLPEDAAAAAYKIADAMIAKRGKP